MTDFLTRLLERTQGAIPARQLAQPVLHSAFAPPPMGMESPIEMYEERDANSVTSSFGEQPAQERSPTKTQIVPYSASQAGSSMASSVDGQVLEAFETPASTESTPRTTSNASQTFRREQHQGVQGEQNEGHQEMMLESAEEQKVRSANQHTSYSHKTTESQPLSVSTSLPSPHLQADFMQASQTDTIIKTQDISLVDEHGNGTQESKEDVLEGRELLVEGQQPTLTRQQQAALPSPAPSDGGKVERIEELTLTVNEVGLPKERLQMPENRQQANELLLPQQTLHQNTVQGSMQRENGRSTTASSGYELELQEELLITPQSSTLPLQASPASALFTSPTALLSEQEHIERIEAARPSRDDVTRELVSREEVVRVQREVLQKEQVRVVEQMYQEQARRNDADSPRRIIPTQTHALHQGQGVVFSTKEPTTPPVTPQVPPTIQVSIGRIEVRAVTAPTPAPRPKPARPSPSLSLEEYLKQQRGGR